MHKLPPHMRTHKSRHSAIDQHQQAAPGYHSIKQFHQLVELYTGSVATVFQAVDFAGTRVVIKSYHKVGLGLT